MANEFILKVYVGETHQVTVPVTDSDGNAIDLTGETLSVHFETQCQEDVAKVSGINPSGVSNNEVSFDLPAALTSTVDTYDMAIRDSSNRVRMTAPVEVQYAASVP